jgi:GNAT superfamily N-acetyltransferase
MNNQVRIRKANTTDFPGWCDLYRGYAEFYKVPMNDRILETLWGWIHDPHHEINCLVAFVDEDDLPSGFAHVRRMPSPLRGTDVGFLDDLFVDPDARGANIGKALFGALEDHAREQKWPIIRWITADDNYRARALYDQLATKTMWNTYQMDISLNQE